MVGNTGGFGGSGMLFTTVWRLSPRCFDSVNAVLVSSSATPKNIICVSCLVIVTCCCVITESCLGMISLAISIESVTVSFNESNSCSSTLVVFFDLRACVSAVVARARAVAASLSWTSTCFFRLSAYWVASSDCSLNTRISCMYAASLLEMIWVFTNSTSMTIPHTTSAILRSSCCLFCICCSNCVNLLLIIFSCSMLFYGFL